LGKTNLSEWANFRSTNFVLVGAVEEVKVRTPYIFDHNPCGSSAGSGVAVSNLCTVSVGTETDGSVVCPSSVSGVVGIKYNWPGKCEVLYQFHLHKTAGPMARTVTDAAILLGVLAGVDIWMLSLWVVSEKESDLKYLDSKFLAGKRIGIEKMSKVQIIYCMPFKNNLSILLKV
jgi:amidase